MSGSKTSVYQSHRFEAIDQYQGAYSYFAEQMRQLDAGALDVSIETLGFSDLEVQRFSINRTIEMDCVLPAGYTSFVISPARQHETRWCGRLVHSDNLVVLRPEREHHIRLAEGWNDLMVTVADELLVARGIATEDLLDQTNNPGNGQLRLTRSFAMCQRRWFQSLFNQVTELDSAKSHHLREIILGELAQAIRIGSTD